MRTSKFTTEQIAFALNHAESEVTRIYARHSYDQEKAQALIAWADKLIDMLV